MRHPRTKALAGSHQWIDAANLKMSLAIADKIRTHPQLLGVARRNLKRWKRKIRPCPKALREWDQILRTYPIEAILDILPNPLRRDSDCARAILLLGDYRTKNAFPFWV